jgi:putative ABC transport system substrate-binding protein
MAWPIAGRAQQPEGIRRVGVLNPSRENDPDAQARVTAFGLTVPPAMLDLATR